MVSCILQGPQEVHGQTERRGRERGAGVEGTEWKSVEHKVLHEKVTAEHKVLYEKVTTIKAALIHQHLQGMSFDFFYTSFFQSLNINRSNFDKGLLGSCEKDSDVSFLRNTVVTSFFP